MGNEEYVKKVYVSGVEGCSRRVQPLVGWEDRVKEYVSERGVRGHGLYSVYVSGVEGCSRRVQPLVRWEDRVKEYVSERGVRGHGLYRVCM